MSLLLHKCPQELLDTLNTTPPVEEKIEHPLEPPSYSENTIREMLAHIHPDIDYDQWTRIGMAIHSQGYNLKLWEEWSSNGEKYKQGECQKKWNSFRLKTDGVSIGTLVKIAKDNGWNTKKLQSCKKQSKSFGFIKASDLINNMKPTKWLIKDYLEEYTLSLIFGEPASGKSFVDIDIACCIASNKKWHNHQVKQGAVFYIAGEGHNGLAKRIKAWELTHQTPLSSAPLYISNKSATLYNRESALEVKQAIKELLEIGKTHPALIIIDTLARNFGGADENSAKDINEFIQNIDEIKSTWNASIIIVHHSGHSEKNRARGSTALKGAMDQEYKVEKKNSLITLKNTKMKDAESPEGKIFKLSILHFQINNTTKIMNSAALTFFDKTTISIRLSDTQRKALSVIKDNVNPNNHSISIKNARQLLKESQLTLSDKPDTIRKTADRNLKELENKGLIKVDSLNLYLLDNQDTNGQDTFINKDGHGQ